MVSNNKNLYIWIGIGVDEQLTAIRTRVEDLKMKFQTADKGLSLPFHISLKMSFPINAERACEAIRDIKAYLSGIKPFDIPVKGYEYHKNIAWIRMDENVTLNRIHDDLNKMLFDEYGVGLHEYDRDYLFHATLFMDDDTEKTYECYRSALGTPCPTVLTAKRFLIGVSGSGEPGTYRIAEEIYNG